MVDQHSRTTLSRVQGPVRSTCGLGHSGPCPMSSVVDQLSRATHAQIRVSASLSSCLVQPGPFLRARRVDQLSRETRDLVGGPAVSTSLPAELRPLPEGLRHPPAVPGDSGPGPSACRVDQLSRVT